MKTARWIGSAACLGALMVASQGFAAVQPTGKQVETFSAGIVSKTKLPGTLTKSGVRFTSTDSFTNVTFGQGATDYNGAAVDFRGKEGEFLTSQLYTSWELSVGATPTKAAAAAACSASAAALGAVTFDAVGSSSSLSTLAGFSEKSLAFAVGAPIEEYLVTNNFSSKAVPELNGARVEIISSGKITKVDAATGIVNADISGKIYASDALAASAPPVGGSRNDWGRNMLAFGFIGLMGIVALRRTRVVPSSAA